MSIRIHRALAFVAAAVVSAFAQAEDEPVEKQIEALQKQWVQAVEDRDLETITCCRKRAIPSSPGAWIRDALISFGQRAPDQGVSEKAIEAVGRFSCTCSAYLKRLAQTGADGVFIQPGSAWGLWKPGSNLVQVRASRSVG